MEYSGVIKTYDELKYLLNVKRTQIEMMRDRGFRINDTELRLLDDDYDESAFYEDYSDMTKSIRESPSPLIDKKTKGEFLNISLSMIYFSVDGKKASYVFYMDNIESDNKATEKQLRILNNIINLFIVSEYNIDTIVIISKEEIGDNDKNKFIIPLKEYYIQLFVFNDLSVNKTKHKYVPQHVILSEQEATNYYKRTNTSPDEQKEICYDDQIVKYYGGKPGQLVKIYRKEILVPMTVKREIVHRIITRYSVYTTDVR